jgi:hypothetical protein
MCVDMYVLKKIPGNDLGELFPAFPPDFGAGPTSGPCKVINLKGYPVGLDRLVLIPNLVD